MTISTYEAVIYTVMFLVPGFIIDEIVATLMPMKIYSDAARTLKYIGYSVSQLQCMLDKAMAYGYKNAGFILDRGYFSRENIKYMDKCGYDFVIMVKV